MSGLILSNLGQSLSAMGSQFGQAALRQDEMNRLMDREELRAQRQMEREEARDDRKIQREESKIEQEKQKMISDIREAKTGAERMGVDRLSGQVASVGSTIGGASPQASQEEISQMIAENPEYADIYKRSLGASGLIEQGMDPRLQQATDEYEAALAAGAGSKAVEALGKQKTDMLNIIKEEYKEKKDTATAARLEKKDDRQYEFQLEQLKIQSKNADANMTRALGIAQKAAETAKDTSTSELLRSLETSRKKIQMDRDALIKTHEAKIKGLRREERNTEMDSFQSALSRLETESSNLDTLINQAQQRIIRKIEQTGPDPKTSQPTNRAASALPKPTSSVELNNLPKGTKYQAPDGSIRIKG
jgi:hypothetical protein